MPRHLRAGTHKRDTGQDEPGRTGELERAARAAGAQAQPADKPMRRGREPPVQHRRMARAAVMALAQSRELVVHTSPVLCIFRCRLEAGTRATPIARTGPATHECSKHAGPRRMPSRTPPKSRPECADSATFLAPRRTLRFPRRGPSIGARDFFPGTFPGSVKTKLTAKTALAKGSVCPKRLIDETRWWASAH